MSVYKKGQYYIAGKAGNDPSTFPNAVINRVYAVPASLEIGILDSLVIDCAIAVASTTVRLGIYTDTDGYPDAVVLDAGTVDTSSTGVKTLSISQRIEEPGPYWFAVCWQGGASPPSLRAAQESANNELPQGTSISAGNPLCTMLRSGNTYSGALGVFGTPTVDIVNDMVRVFFRYATTQIITLDAVTENDEAGIVDATLNPPTPGAIHYTEETDIAQTLSPQRRYALGQATETDEVQTLTPRLGHRIDVVAATETDTAQSLALGMMVRDLTTGVDSTDASSYVTANNITPTSNRLVLAAVFSVASATAPVPTVTGNGLTWVNQQSISDNVTIFGTEFPARLTVFRAMGASPTTGAVTMSFGGNTQFICDYSIIEIGGVDTSGTNGSGAVVQSAGNVGDDVASLEVPLLAFGSSANGAYGAFSLQAAPVLVAGSGFSILVSSASGDAGTIATEFKHSEDTTVDLSHTGSTRDMFGIALEIKRA